MISIQRCSTVLALAVMTVGAVAHAGTQVKGGPFDPVNGKMERVPENSGKALCFGDATGAKCPSNNIGKAGRGCNNSANLGGARLWADGDAKVARDTIALHVLYMPAPTTVIFLQAEGCRNNELGLPFGDGLMCLGRSTMKLGAFKARDRATFPPPGISRTLSDVGFLPPKGGERYYQVLYRDPQPLGTPGQGQFNLSNAWSIVWAP